MGLYVCVHMYTTAYMCVYVWVPSSSGVSRNSNFQHDWLWLQTSKSKSKVEQSNGGDEHFFCDRSIIKASKGVQAHVEVKLDSKIVLSNPNIVAL